MAKHTFNYNGAFKQYITQFMRIFSGFQVQFNRDTDGDDIKDLKTCPVYYGSMDRITANILKKDGIATAISLPIMSANLTGIELNPEIRRTNYHEENVVRTRSSDGLLVVDRKIIGTPYKLSMDLMLYTSSTDQMFQLLEQIMLMFNPRLAIQKSDDIRDFTYISEIELVAVNQETNIPTGTEQRMVMWSLSFLIDVWIDYPILSSTSIIEEIITTIKDDTFDPDGVDLDVFVADQN